MNATTHSTYVGGRRGDSPNLREYQSRAIDEARAHVVAGRRAPLLAAPCGAGKTTIFSAMAAGHVAQGGRVLVLVHRVELLHQAAERLSAYGLPVDVVAATERRALTGAPVVVAMMQTLVARELRPAASLVVVDEAHLSAAREWSALLQAYPDVLRVGASATPCRADGIGLGTLFDCIVPVASVAELTKAGHLVPASIIAPARELRSGQIAQAPVNAYLAHASERLAVVFSPHVAAAEKHTAEFIAAGVTVALITGETAPAERAQAIADHAAGRIRVLVNVGCLTTGWDSPATSCAILARGFGHLSLYLQSVGRVLRPHPASGKQSALIIDLRGVSHTLGHPAEDVTYSLEGDGVRRVGCDVPPLCMVCGAPVTPDGCPDCGRSPAELKQLRVTGAALVKFAAVRRDTPEQQAERLAKWIKEARQLRQKDGRAMFRFKGAFGTWPSDTVKRLALRLAAS